jgi:hypothetical protein
MVESEGYGYFQVPNTACAEYFPIFQVLSLIVGNPSLHEVLQYAVV